jgi:hypothetical protein
VYGRIATLAGVVLSLAVSGGATARAETAKAIWGPYLHEGVSQFPVYRELGASIYEEDLHWDQVALARPKHPRDPGDPAYKWPEALTRAVAEANAHGMRVALQIIGAPRWANGGHTAVWAPLRPGDFANFAIAATHRYPTVKLWMVWGEPVRRHDFEPLTPARPYAELNARQRRAPHLYARILDGAYLALKHVRRSNLVIGGMTDTAADITTRQWIENLRLPGGRPPRMDLYGHNPFSARAPNLANPPAPGQQFDFSDLRRLGALVDRQLARPGYRAPLLFLSEWTVPTAPDKEFDFFVDPARQAAWISDGLKVARSLPQVYAVGWIHLYDDPPAYTGGLIGADGVRKPGFAAFRGG